VFIKSVRLSGVGLIEIYKERTINLDVVVTVTITGNVEGTGKLSRPSVVFIVFESLVVDRCLC